METTRAHDKKEGAYVIIGWDDADNLLMMPTKLALEEKKIFKHMDEEDALRYLLQDHLYTWLEWIRPEEVGALTSSVIFSEAQACKRNFDGELIRCDYVWWFPNYAITDPVADLLKRGGKVVWTKEVGE